MSLKRRSYEAGHKPKFLVVIDESPECDRAVYYASRRASRTGASVMMLLVIEPHDRHQQWLGVADIMKAEAHEAADQKLDAFSARANGVAGITPERVIRDGDTSEEILKLIDEDEDIAILVLAVVLLLTNQFALNRDNNPVAVAPMASTILQKSIAVLPFRNMSGDPEQSISPTARFL